MTIRTRRFIYISFIIAFLLIAPLLVLYTAGYRWNSYHNRLQKIGSLVIRTMPRTVTIDVADMHVTKTTPWRYNDLLPNEYVVTITKDGYDTWQKKNSQFTRVKRPLRSMSICLKTTASPN